MAGTQGRRQVRVGAYNIDDLIGAGSFAKVFRGQHRASGTVVAVKAITRARLNRKLMDNLESEIAILKTVKHPNIVALHDIQVRCGRAARSCAPGRRGPSRPGR